MFPSSNMKTWVKVKEEGENGYQNALNLAREFYITSDQTKGIALIYQARK